MFGASLNKTFPSFIPRPNKKKRKKKDVSVHEYVFVGLLWTVSQEPRDWLPNKGWQPPGYTIGRK